MMFSSSLFLFTDAASTLGKDVDTFYFFLIGLAAVFTAGIAGAILVFSVRYRRQEGNEVATAIEGSTALEIFWSGVPFLISMFIFTWSATLFLRYERPPDDAMEMFVVGKQWMWKVQHMNGRREINTMHVPIDRAVKVTLTSEDVIHSFFIPAFRVKRDAVPGRYSQLWFEATKAGEYHLFCAEYCGTEHSRMIGKVIAMEPADYQQWLANPPAGIPAPPAPKKIGKKRTKKGSSGATAAKAPEVAPAEQGRMLFLTQGCVACHIDAPTSIGPSLTGLLGKSRKFVDGTTKVADDNYIRQSLLEPMAEVVDGYPPLMPTFAGKLSEEELMSLVFYIKSLTPSSGDDATEKGQ